MRSSEIRQTFLNYFNEHGHQIVPSSSLVPGNDKTLLFTNAGMVQFKDVFLGLDKRSYNRATTSQRCVRAGGKHNDLENVGYTARHHTFFEMLGNFSFGDYFKEDAIKFAWELITQHFKLPKEKLWVTVFEEDDQAYDIWANIIGVPTNRISRIGAKDNFWQMGDTGPCGPCTEIFYDHGDHIWGGPPGTPEEDGDRYIEIWNLVFMQYDRQADGTLNPLPKPSVDTGMGLERVAAILQGVHSNYEIDIFVALIKAAALATNNADLQDSSLKVIADHIRSVAFMLIDGVIPSNEGRGYVLRRIIRRAIRHGYKLGQKEVFFYKLVAELANQMGDAYPELYEKQHQIEKAITLEETRFAKTLDEGMQLLEADLANLEGNVISGQTLFKLYDTYGFPVDLTSDIARERGLDIDLEGYEAAMQVQRQQAQNTKSFKSATLLKTNLKTIFDGYDKLQLNSKIASIFIDEEPVETIDSDNTEIDSKTIIILDSTPFYGESGGQIGDIGVITSATGKFIVTDTQKQSNTFLHIGYVAEGHFKIADSVEAEVDLEHRNAIKRHHSATHLLHAALRQVLDNSVQQKGSLVNEQRLRFDFAYSQAVTKEELQLIEDLVNKTILANLPVTSELMNQKQAVDKGAMALFGEKYGEIVRVLSMGNFSTELCGGTHVHATGEIGQLIIVSENGVAAGVRRIEAIAGLSAIAYHREKQNKLTHISTLLKTNEDNITNKIMQLTEKNKELLVQIKNLKSGAFTNPNSSFEGRTQIINNYKVLTSKVEGFASEELRHLADKMRDKNALDLVLLATEEDGKAKLVISIGDNAKHKLHAGNIIAEVAAIVDGKGGGRADFAQAGGNDPTKIAEALHAINEILSKY